jgi:DNA-directed RNA polymerase subunit RPC12/RpoP
MAKKKAAPRAGTSNKTRSTKKAASTVSEDKPRCGLCGATKNLIKTECCGNWICNDEANYVAFSYAQNSCHRNHWRYTLCGYHFNEQHEGNWQDCNKCRDGFETEMYVWYGTNEFNFDVLKNPPEYEPTKCSDCGAIIVLGDGGYMTSGDDYFCGHCSAKRMREGR